MDVLQDWLLVKLAEFTCLVDVDRAAIYLASGRVLEGVPLSMLVVLFHRIELRARGLSTANFRISINVKRPTQLVDANLDLCACGPGRKHITTQLDWEAR